MGYVMKSDEFIKKLKDIASNYKTLYIMGCFGSPMTESNKVRYTQNHSYNMNPTRVKMINSATSDTFGFDCVNLIKGILWGWNGDKTKSYGGAKYQSNGVLDEGADIFFKTRCKASQDWTNIEPGEAVWMSGHIGVYIGEGLVVECTPKWSNNVQITAVGNIGAKAGYNTRNWTSHGKIEYIDYSKPVNQVQTNPNTPSDYAKSAWEKAKANGILDGSNPKNPLTREQLAVVLDRLNLLN